MEEFKIGDKVIISEFYLNRYPNWSIKGQIGKVVKIDVRPFHPSLLKESPLETLYPQRYGKQEQYLSLGMLVEFGNSTYLVHQFGVDHLP